MEGDGRHGTIDQRGLRVVDHGHRFGLGSSRFADKRPKKVIYCGSVITQLKATFTKGPLTPFHKPIYRCRYKMGRKCVTLFEDDP